MLDKLPMSPLQRVRLTGSAARGICLELLFANAASSHKHL
jgi:hypothetical protein